MAKTAKTSNKGKKSKCSVSETSLDRLKKEYAKLQKKYSLPSFNELNEDFHIERVMDMETYFLIREIRRFMADKFSGYLRFAETLLNPANAPMFVFSFIRVLGSEEKKKLAEIYKKLAKIEVEIIEADLNFSEEKEAEFIRNSYEIWQEIKKDLSEILEKVKNNWDAKFETNGRGYFG